MKNKILKAGVLALVLGIAGSAMAKNDGTNLIVNPYDEFGNTTSSSKYQTVLGSNNATDGLRASVYGTKSSATGTDTTAIGSYAIVDATNSTAVGSYVTTTGDYSVALGSGLDNTDMTTAAGEKSVAIGYTAKTSATAGESIALGSEANAQAASAVAVGKGATVNAESGLAVGTSSNVAAANAIALGTSGYAGAENSTAIGTGSRVADTATGGVAIGNGAYVTKAGSVAIGEGAAVSATKNPMDKVVSFGHTTYDTYYDAKTGKNVAYDSAETSRLVNVTAGYQDTDAVNFSQIKTVARSTEDGNLANGTYIASSLNTDGTALNDTGTVGANIQALDAKAVDSAQTVVLSNVARDTAKDYAGKKNEIVSNDGTVLATFDYTTIEDTMTEENRAKFVSAGDVYDAIAKRAQTVTLDATTTRETVNKKEIKGNQITTNDGTVLATFESEKPSSLDGKKFVTSGDVYAADVKSSQEVTLATSARETVNKVSIQKNQIATNDGTVVATFTSEKPAALDGTAFVTSGDVYAADTKEAQTVTLDISARETVNKVSIQKNQIATNEGKVLADFQLAEYQTGDKGFVNGGQLFDQTIAADQQVSFATGKNVIKNNKDDELVSFTEGVVAVAGGAKGATNTDANFVSARNAYANDVAYAQDLTLNIGNSYTADIVTNAGAKVGTLKIEGGEIASGNTGFVTGDQVWKAIASYNQKLDFSDVTPSNSNEATPTDETGGDTTGGATDGDTTGGDTTGGETGGQTAAPKSSNVIYTNDGTPIAELVQGEVSKENTGFVSGGQVYDADIAAGQEIDLNNSVIKNNAGDVLVTLKKAEIKNNDAGIATGGQVFDTAIKEDQTVSFDEGKNVITNNNDKTLVTFTKAEVSEGNTGFATGGQVFSNSVASGQEVSFSEGMNLIKNNAKDTLVTFKVGEAKEGDTGFVSGDAAWKGDVAQGTVTLAEGENVIKSNNGDTLVTIQKGDIAEGNTGFVSGGQVYSAVQNVSSGTDEKFDKVNTQIAETNTRIDETNQNVTKLSTRVDDVDDRVKEVGAGAAALAALHPMDYDPNAKLTFAVGYGNYKSKSAAAIGAFIRPNDRVMWSLGATIGNGNNMVNTGLSFAIGSGSGQNMSRAQLADTVKNMKTDIDALRGEHQTFARDNAQQDAAILDLHARLKIVEEFIQKLSKE